MKVEGGCHCGQIAYTASVDPDTVRICHCTDCQKLTGSAYRVVVRAPAAGFSLTRGVPKTYIKTAESGTRRAHAFCPDCGSPLYAAALKDTPFYSLRLGSIKERAVLMPKEQIWCRSALPWSGDLHGIESRERE